MEPAIGEKVVLQPDIRMITRLVFEISLLRRHVRTYPKNHGIILNTVRRIAPLISRLFETCDHFAMGVARESLLINEGVLDRKSILLKDLARTLFSHRIASITFKEGFTGEELLHFAEIINEQPAPEPGRLARAMAAAGVTHLQITETDYRSFRITEEDQISPADAEDEKEGTLWSRFIQGLLGGVLEPDAHSDEISPEALAGMFNRLLETNPDMFKISDYDQVINSFIKQLEKTPASPIKRDKTLDLIGIFISNLVPEIRVLFLDSIFSMLSANRSFSEKILSRFPDEIIIEILANIRSGKTSVPPVVLDIMETFAERLMDRRGDQLFPAALDTAGRTLNAWMNPVFSQEELAGINLSLSAPASPEGLAAASAISDPGLAELEEIKDDLTGHGLERKLSSVLQELIDSDPRGGGWEALADHLVDQCRYFLELGDYRSLAFTYERLINQTAEDRPAAARLRLLNHFESSEFIGEILDGLHVWGREKYGEIQQLILMVGRPFVRPMLDRMGEEENMSLRRYYLDRIQELGEHAVEDVVNRLHDSRWYCIRNMLLILRSNNDPAILPEIHKLKGYSHPRIRIEVIRTLQHFNDPEADVLILKDLNGQNPLLQLNAVTLARYSTSHEVFYHLLDYLNKPGYAGTELEMKVAVVHSLAGFASREAIPALRQLLDAKHLLHMPALNKLKQEVIRSLARYPASLATPLLARVVGRGSSELSRLAAETLSTLPGGRP